MGILSNTWRHWQLTILTVATIVPIALVANAGNYYQQAQAAPVTESIDYLVVAIQQLVVALALLSILVLGIGYYLRKLSIRVDKLEQAVVADR